MNKKTYALFSCFLFFLFIFFSYLVSKELFLKIDFDTTVKIQDKIPRFFDYPFSMLSILGSAEFTGFIWLLLVVGFLVKKYFLTVMGLFSLPLALVIEIFGKLFVHHPGPPKMFFRGLIELDLPSHYVPVDYAYPSGHMMRTAYLVCFTIVYMVLNHQFKRHFLVSFLLIVLLILMFISRIYLGEHWLSDVVGGLLLGSSFGILTALTISHKKIALSNISK